MKRRIVFIVLLIFVMGIFLFNRNDSNNLKDNYYNFINYSTLEENKLEEGEYSWSYFVEAQERVDENSSLIVKEVISGNNNFLSDEEVEVIKSIYDKANDVDKRNSDGIKDLSPYLDRVWNVDTIEELIEVINIVEIELGVDILTNIEFIQDYEDNSHNIVYFSPVTLAFGVTGDYIVDDDYMAYKAYIKRACVQLWKAYGKDKKEAREIVNRVFAFYEEVSNSSKLSSELEDITNYYNVINEEEFNSIFSNVNSNYLDKKGLNNREKYSIVDKEQYKYLNDSLKLENLDIWKEVIITKILSSYAIYGSSEYVEIVEDLNSSLLGSVNDKTDEEYALDIVKNIFSDEIDMIYENKYLTSNQEKEIEGMVLEIKEVYKERLSANEWLDSETIVKAIDKLDKMKVIVGEDKDSINYGLAKSLGISRDSLIKDVIKIQQIVMKNDLERLDSNKNINLVKQTQVNAYYQPLDNSVVIPVAFFELVDESGDYYEKLGTMGMILAHEVTHGFDGNGSKFDSNGNMNEWWSEEDKNNFEMFKQEVSDYYSKYEVLDGKYINGDKTVNENIADLGALECVIDIANERGASDQEYKLMFSSFAKVWASNESEEYMEMLLLQDVHSPNLFRVNAVMSSMDEFYQVYNVYPWNDMWVSKDNRVEVW